jgi:hypothetical protein
LGGGQTAAGGGRIGSMERDEGGHVMQGVLVQRLVHVIG